MELPTLKWFFLVAKSHMGNLDQIGICTIKKFCLTSQSNPTR